MRERRVSLYGDGKWHFTSGERRASQRRLGKPRTKVSLDSPEFDNLSLEDQLDALSNTAAQTEAMSLDDSPKNVSISVEPFDAEAILQPKGSTVTQRTNSNSAFESFSAPSWDAQRAIENGDKSSTTDTGSSNTTKTEQQSDSNSETTEAKNLFDKTIENADREAHENNSTVTNKTLGPEEQARLHSLKSMLDASNARYAQASRKRSPVFAAGLAVRVTQGSHMGSIGTIVDADYIEDRALLNLPDQDTPKWVEFKSLGHAD